MGLDIWLANFSEFHLTDYLDLAAHGSRTFKLNFKYYIVFLKMAGEPKDQIFSWILDIKFSSEMCF